MNSSNSRPEQKSSKLGATPNSVSVDTLERRLIPRAFPSPEIIEGSESSDWALWEAAVASVAGPQPTTIPKKEEEFSDPFASVRKQRNIL